MRELVADLVQRLDLETAIHTEAVEKRELMPEEPGWDRLVARAQSVADWLRARLEAGYLPSQQVVVNARKAGHGVRPVAVLHPLDRVVYRALAALVLGDADPIDRSREAYREFVLAPIKYAYPGIESDPFAIMQETSVKYVVKTDFVAFYQYVDHEVLSSELLLRQGEFRAISALIDFLGDLQGRRFGLPQQLDVSHSLSEYYADVVERKMIREGYAVWRFNDDFRIAVDSYPDALRAIDTISSFARDVGLVIGEHKTSTPSLDKYVTNSPDFDVQHTGPLDLSAEDAVGDYTDVDPADLEEARALIEAAMPSANATIDIRNAGPDDVKNLRRALAAFRLAEDSSAVDSVTRLMAYVAALTPDIARYLVALQNDESAGHATESILRDVSLNEWQALWMADTVRQLGVLHPERLAHSDLAYRWTREHALTDRSALVRAHSMWALADAGRVTVADIEDSMRGAPSALAAWYLSALSHRVADLSVADARVMRAISGESQFNSWMLS